MLNPRKAFIFFFILMFVVAALFQYSKSRTSQLFGKITNRVETTEKVVALTFDDGPTETATPKVLSILAEKGIKATFFLTGKEIETNTSSAMEICKAGHEIGNHSYSHERLVLCGYEKVSEEIERTNALIVSLGFSGTISFRPPYGKKLFNLPRYLCDHNIETITWDVEPDTYIKSGNVADLVNYTSTSVKPGSIILLHPMYKSKESTLEAIPLIIDDLRSKGYRFLTISELLKLRNDA